MTSVTITPSVGTWHLNICTVLDDGEIRIKILPFDRLVEAMDAATTLRLHVENLDELPLSQYKTYDAA